MNHPDHTIASMLIRMGAADDDDAAWDIIEAMDRRPSVDQSGWYAHAVARLDAIDAEDAEPEDDEIVVRRAA